MLRFLWLGFVACVVWGFSSPAFGAFQLGATRLVMGADTDNTASISVADRGDSPILIQSWLSLGDRFSSLRNGNRGAKEKTILSSFIVTPPLFRLDPGEKGALRILTSGEDIPTTRESLLWLTVQEIPPLVNRQSRIQKKNVVGGGLQIALAQRIKVFYRPHGLPGNANEAYKGIRWSLARQCDDVILIAQNSTPYHVTLSKLGLRLGTHLTAITPQIIYPYSRSFIRLSKKSIVKDRQGRELRFLHAVAREIPLDKKISTDFSISYSEIDDYGGEPPALVFEHIPSNPSFSSSCQRQLSRR